MLYRHTAFGYAPCRVAWRCFLVVLFFLLNCFSRVHLLVPWHCSHTFGRQLAYTRGMHNEDAQVFFPSDTTEVEPPLSVGGRVKQYVLTLVWGGWMVGRDAVAGFWFLARHGFAVLGLLLALLLGYLFSNPQETAAREQQLFGWLLQRQQVPDTDIPELKNAGYRSVVIPADPSAAKRTIVADAPVLDSTQQRVADWLARKYRIAPQPMGALVQEAYALGERTGIDPLLIMSVMAIESRFNPYAQSSVGAQGLMQVMTGVHRDKYLHFGGKQAAFDPVTNMRVGVKILHEAIALSGSVEGGLRRYVGATSVYTEGGYGRRVLAEYARLYNVAEGRETGFHANLPRRSPNTRGRSLPALSFDAP